MKKKLIAGMVMIVWSSIQSFAQQSPLVGTWEMVSGKITGPEGQKATIDMKTHRETKIITPSHYMLISQNIRGDSLLFERTLGGTIRITGNKFVETPTIASDPEELKIKTDFTWKIEGEKMIQKGPVTQADGKVVMLDELIFKRVSPAPKEVARSK
jgi:hypothetical protein